MSHREHMHHCLSIAEGGRGKVGTNPMVGAVLVRNDSIIAQGYHQAFGQSHAERELIKNFDQDIAYEDVLYVNLEPCCHTGKTPPCTDAIIQAGIRTVVFGMYDPNTQVSGRGIEALRAAGIRCIGPVASVECRRFNRGFVSLHQQGRPWVTLKSARNTSGQFCSDDGKPLKITSKEQNEWSHRFLRAKHDAILVGVGTILSDDPLLTVRTTERTSDFQPVKIVLDPHLRTPPESGIFASGHTVLVTDQNADSDQYKAFDRPGTDIITMNGGSVFDIKSVLVRLCEEKMLCSVLVEGGPKTWDAFRKSGCVDEEVFLMGS